MKRRFCNEGGVGIAGMEHLHVTRSLQGVSWWSGEDALRGPPTKTLFDETYPKGHYAWKTNKTQFIPHRSINIPIKEGLKRVVGIKKKFSSSLTDHGPMRTGRAPSKQSTSVRILRWVIYAPEKFRNL